MIYIPAVGLSSLRRIVRLGLNHRLSWSRRGLVILGLRVEGGGLHPSRRRLLPLKGHFGDYFYLGKNARERERIKKGCGKEPKEKIINKKMVKTSPVTVFFKNIFLHKGGGVN